MDIWIPVMVAVITGLFGLAGSFLALNQQRNKFMSELDKKHAIFETTVQTEIKHLREQVEKHNSVIDRTYQLEAKTERQDDELKRLNRRLEIVEGE